jgi:ADP-ribose pyrophosphatase YjhB (NUDIX family)
MKKFDKFFLSAVFLSILINVSSSFIDSKFPLLSEYSFYVIGVALLFWILYRIGELVFNYIRYGRFAVLVFFVNSKKELLLVKHPFHGCYLPVGGRLNQWELPHNAVKRKLSEEAGIKDFIFHPKFHNENLMISEIVENVPRPYSVHMEHRNQRGIVKFHYAFVYVCKFKGRDEPIEIANEHQPCWKNIEDIRKLAKGLRPFDDIIIRYEDILTQI